MKAGAWLAIGVLDVVALNVFVVPRLDGASTSPGAASAALATSASKPAARPALVEPTPPPAPVAVAVAAPVVEPTPPPAPVVEPTPPAPVVAAAAPVADPDPDPDPDPVTDPDPDPVTDPVADPVPDPDPERDPVTIHFGFDRATILPVAARHLDGLHQLLLDHPTWTLTVTGYASPDGEDDHNRALSLRRAVRIQEYLVARGVDPARFELRGRGATGAARRTATIVVEEHP